MAKPAARWRSTELLTVANPHLGQRPFHARSAQREPEIVEAFGGSTPSSAQVLLHTYDPPPSPSGGPVVLVHGANRNASYFLDPHEDGSFRDPLPELFRGAGRAVYAVSFAHNQDDNWWWCEALNEAVLEISRRHPEQKLTLLGHSKGGLAVRLAVTDWRPSPGCRRDLSPLIERILLVGTPNGGVDFFYRYPSINLAFSGPGQEAVLNWPTSWHEIRAGVKWRPLPQWYGAEPCLYPGQAQLLARWRERYPLPGLDPSEETTYEGGESLLGRCHGINHAIALSGDMVGELRRRPVRGGVLVALVAGASPTMPAVLNDTTGPSDGIVFVQSALEMPEGSAVVSARTLPVHHKALIAAPEAHEALLEGLHAVTPLSSSELAQQRRAGLELGEEMRLAARSPLLNAWGTSS